jgi:hypothetical protein
MPYPSTFPPLSIPGGIDLWTLLLGRKEREFPLTKEILTCGETGRSYSWGDLRSASIEFGKGLKALWSWKKGHVLAFYTPNSIDVRDTPPHRTSAMLCANHQSRPQS